MSEAPVSMVERIVLILKAFEGSQASRLNLGEIATLTNLPKSSTFRILQQLVDARLVEREDKDYRLGLGIFELGSLFPHRNKIVAYAKPYMQELSAGGRFVAHLAMIDGTEVVYLDKIGGRFAGSLPSRIGGRFTAHKTAVGKSILALANPIQLDNYLEEMFVKKNDTQGMQKLQDEIVKIRQLNYATERNEAVEGVACVAAPIPHGNGTMAAISICGPAEHISEEKLRGNIRVAATAISRGIAFKSPRGRNAA